MSQAFLDEQILKKREENLKKSHITLDKGMYIQREVVTFERQEMEELFSVMLPTTFEMMPEELAQIKYPSVFRPHWIYTSLDLSVNIGFSLFPDNLKSKSIKEVTNRVRRTLEREEAGFLFSPCHEMKKKANIVGCWFDFRSQAMDSGIYNLMLIALIKNRLIQVSFNCPIKLYTDWNQAVLQMLESIEPLEKEKR